MFWTWNSGYIFFKLEGNSPVSTQPNGKIEYHIGGFQSPTSAIRKYTGQLTGPDKWVLGNGQTISFDINVAIDRFFALVGLQPGFKNPHCVAINEMQF